MTFIWSDSAIDNRHCSSCFTSPKLGGRPNVTVPRKDSKPIYQNISKRCLLVLTLNGSTPKDILPLAIPFLGVEQTEGCHRRGHVLAT